MPSPLETFRSYVLAEVPQLPDIVADLFIKRAIREICSETNILQSSAYVPLDDNDGTISLTTRLEKLSEESEVVDILYVKKIGYDEPLIPKTKVQLSREMPNWRYLVGEPRFWVSDYETGANNLVIVPRDNTAMVRTVVTEIDGNTPYPVQATQITTATAHGYKVGDTASFHYMTSPAMLYDNRALEVIKIGSDTVFWVSSSSVNWTTSTFLDEERIPITAADVSDQDGVTLTLEKNPAAQPYEIPLYDVTSKTFPFRVGDRLRMSTAGGNNDVAIDGLESAGGGEFVFEDGEEVVIDEIISVGETDGTLPIVRVKSGEDFSTYDPWVSGGTITRSFRQFVTIKAEYEIRYSWQPKGRTGSSNTLPSIFEREYIEEVLAGAFSKIYRMPQKTWTDYSLASAYSQSFVEGKKRIKSDAEREGMLPVASKVKYGGY